MSKKNSSSAPCFSYAAAIATGSPTSFKSIDRQYTYFVHSYYAKCAEEYVVSTVDYGVAVPAIVQKDNVYGFQFHPEKSGQVGLKLLQTFFEKAVKA